MANEQIADDRLKSLMASPDTHAQLRAIANRRDITITEALDRFGGPGIQREYKRVVAEMHHELGENGGA